MGEPAERPTTTLAAAARRARVSPGLMRQALRDGTIRGRSIEPRGWLIYTHELEEDLAQHACCYPGCDGYALGTSGGCRKHHAQLSHTGKPRPREVVEQVAAVQRGKPRIAMRKHVWEERFCQWTECGKSLGVIPGSRVAQGGGRYCDRSCASKAREAAKRAGREVSCPGCSTTRYLSPSVVRRMGDGYCMRCWSELLPDLGRTWRDNRHRALEELKASLKLVDTHDLVEKSGRVDGTVRQRVPAGDLVVATVFNVDGRTLLYTAASAKNWLRKLVYSDHAAYKRWRSREFVGAWLIGNGRLRELRDEGKSDVEAVRQIGREADEIIARHAKAASRLGGRPLGSTTREQLHAFWDQRLDELLAEMPPGSTRFAACMLLAPSEAEHGPRDLFPAATYPRAKHGFGLTADAQRRAATVIYNATNRLQNRRRTALSTMPGPGLS